MIILGIESSCDETSAAVLTDTDGSIRILSSTTASSATLQAKFGGIIPEQAAREQLKSIIPVIQNTLEEAGISPSQLDAIAVTYGPGLIGSLLVGVETAKILATIWQKPLIPINHLLGHFYANWIDSSASFSETPKFPCLGLLVSGGHTDLVYFTDHGKYEYLGGTLDDAAGECFDKCARLLNLPYPGGPEISRLALNGDPAHFPLPTPLQGDRSLNFSYSGLKTAVANLIHKNQSLDDQGRADLAASIEQTIIRSLVDKISLALKQYPTKQIMIAGGVAANAQLKKTLTQTFPNHQILIPPPPLCTDNGAMIASAGFFSPTTIDPVLLQADPNLSLA